MKLRTLSLCSGIGGFELGAKLANQRLGQEVFQLKALCEKSQFCRDRALKPNFPGIPIYEDIRDIAAKFGDYDLIVGGLPCQPFSVAGKKKGADDDRNLFPEFFRILCSVRPKGAVIENVPGLLAADSGRFFRDVLWQFTEAGYSVAWHVVSCAEVGGVHLRERLWIIAYTNSDGRSQQGTISNAALDEKRNIPALEQTGATELYEVVSSGAVDTNSDSFQRLQRQRVSAGQKRKHLPNSIGIRGSRIHADPNGKRCKKLDNAALSDESRLDRGCDFSHVDQSRREQQLQEANQGRSQSGIRDGMRQEEKVEPGIRSVNDGVPSKLVQSHLMTPAELHDRLPYATDPDDTPYRKEMLQALGNAIVPDVAAIALYRFLEVSGLIDPS